MFSSFLENVLERFVYTQSMSLLAKRFFEKQFHDTGCSIVVS